MEQFWNSFGTQFGTLWNCELEQAGTLKDRERCRSGALQVFYLYQTSARANLGHSQQMPRGMSLMPIRNASNGQNMAQMTIGEWPQITRKWQMTIGEWPHIARKWQMTIEESATIGEGPKMARKWLRTHQNGPKSSAVNTRQASHEFSLREYST